MEIQFNKIIFINIFLLCITVFISCSGNDDTVPKAMQTDLYIAATEKIGEKDLSKVLKNGVATSFTGGTKNTHTRSVVVSDANVYLLESGDNATSMKGQLPYRKTKNLSYLLINPPTLPAELCL